MKTTEKEFAHFKAAFRHWQGLLGLTEYHCVFRHQLVEGCFGGIHCNHLGKVVTVLFSTECPDRDRDDYDPDRTGRHEALELLTARMDNLARGHCFPDDIEEERHAIVRRLENLLDEIKGTP
jgi:hypothetical protein